MHSARGGSGRETTDERAVFAHGYSAAITIPLGMRDMLGIESGDTVGVVHDHESGVLEIHPRGPGASGRGDGRSVVSNGGSVSITLPAGMCGRLGIEPGDTVEVAREDGGDVLEVRPEGHDAGSSRVRVRGGG